MKKHIQKRFLNNMEFNDEIKWLPGVIRFDRTVSIKPKEVPKHHKALSITVDKRALICFRYNDKQRVLFIPEPDPILIYFDTAYLNFREIKERRKTCSIISRERKWTKVI